MKLMRIPIDLIFKVIIIVVEAIADTYKRVKNERDSRLQS